MFFEDSDPKQFWNLVNKLKNKKDKNEKVNPEDFFQFFKDLNNVKYTARDSKQSNLIKEQISKMLDKDISVDTLDKQITVEETSYVLKNLKNGKSSGPDTILNEFLKYGKSVLLNH